MGNEKMVDVDGVQICTEAFGDLAHPVLLLIAGAASSMDWWEDAFCARLASQQRYVVRYDCATPAGHRHTRPARPITPASISSRTPQACSTRCAYRAAMSSASRWAEGWPNSRHWSSPPAWHR